MHTNVTHTQDWLMEFTHMTTEVKRYIPFI